MVSYWFSSLYTVIGTAFALNMLFNIPVWIGVLLTGFSTLILLALQKYGVYLYIYIYTSLTYLGFCFLSDLSLGFLRF